MSSPVAFFFNRAQEYNHKKSAFTYAAIIAGGVTLAVLFCLILSDSFFKLRNNFILNPAIAIMYQIFPTSAEKFDALMGTVALELFGSHYHPTCSRYPCLLRGRCG